MKRWERKQHIKELRLAQKLAKKQKQLDAKGVVQPDANADPTSTKTAAAAAGEPPVASEIVASPLATPTLMPAYPVEEAVNNVKQASEQARGSIRQSSLVSADEAAEMLSQASRDLSDVIQAGRRALSQVSPQRLAEATEALNEKRMAEAAHGKPQTRPRRGTDPVITLMKMMVQAVSLLQRVLNRLHPKLRMAA